MKHVILILSVLLLISLAGNWIQYRSAELAQLDRNLEAREFRNRSAEHLHEIASRDTAASIRIKRLQADSVKHAAAQGSLISQIKAYKFKLRNLPPAVHDTVIVLQDSLIADLSAERDTVYLVNAAVLDSLQKSSLQLKELFEGELQNSMRLDNELKREKSRKWSVGPHVGIGIRGADVGVSVQYSLWRF